MALYTKVSIDVTQSLAEALGRSISTSMLAESLQTIQSDTLIALLERLSVEH